MLKLYTNIIELAHPRIIVENRLYNQQQISNQRVPYSSIAASQEITHE